MNGFKAGALGALAAALTWAAATPATAATSVSTDGATITITGGPEVNNVSIDEFSDSILVEDTAAGTTTGAGCSDLTLGSHVYTACPANGANIAASLGAGNDQFVHANPMSNEDGFGSVTVDGGDGADTLDLYNLFPAHKAIVSGGAGDDDLRGGEAGDVVKGEDGNDKVQGSSGADNLTGDDGDDSVSGDGGDDVIDGGTGVDSLKGDSGTGNLADGNDRITSRDGVADQIACGFGSDILTADTKDVADADCESVDREAVTAGGGGDGGGNGAGTIAVSRVPTSLTIAKLFAKGLKFRLTIDVPGQLKALLYVPKKDAKRLGIAKKDFLLAGEAAAVDEAGTFPGNLKPKASVKRKLKGLKTIPAVLAVQLTDGDGNKSLDAAKVKLKR